VFLHVDATARGRYSAICLFPSSLGGPICLLQLVIPPIGATLLLSTLSDSLRADIYYRHRSQHYHYLCSNLCRLVEVSEMRRANYSLEKRQREDAKKKKKEAKHLRKTEKAHQSDQEESKRDFV